MTISIPQTVHVTKGQVTLNREGDDFIMVGPTGTHTLFAPCTPPARLQAHWEGFIQNNGGRLPSQQPVVMRVAWNGSIHVRWCDVLGHGQKPGQFVVAGRVWKSRDEVRIILTETRGGRLVRVSQWTHGNAPKWVKALAQGTKYEEIA